MENINNVDNTNYKHTIEKIYINYLNEKKQVKKLIFDVEKDYNEVENIISSYKDNCKELSIFSPRQNTKSKDNFLKEQLEKSEELKSQIDLYNNKLREIQDNIRAIESIKKSIMFQPGSEILTINENDRKRIARDLHDSTIQNLVYLIHKIEIASKFIDQDPVRSKLELSIVSKNLREVINEMREVVYDLHPMNYDDLGFELALSNFFDNITATSNMKITYKCNINNEKFDDIFLITIFRIIQECCNNAIKHSKGNNIYVEMNEKEDYLFLKIQDDGIGFQKINELDKSKHFGIKIVKERVALLGGDCEFSSTNEGVTIEVKIPISFTIE